MKIVTRDELAKTAAIRIRQHAMGLAENRMPRMDKRPWEIMYDALIAVVNPTAEDVNRITGANKWTYVQCDSCGLGVDGAAEFEASEWPILICHDCLIDAANKLVLEIVK